MMSRLSPLGPCGLAPNVGMEQGLASITRARKGMLDNGSEFDVHVHTLTVPVLTVV